MADEARDKNGSEPAPDGVFGNLPGTRPGTRSPRRHASGDEPAAAATPSPVKKRAPAPPPPPPPSAPEPPSGVERDAPVPSATGEQRIGSVEDLAWASIAVAAQAATVGVRFASRALEAARKSVERP